MSSDYLKKYLSKPGKHKKKHKKEKKRVKSRGAVRLIDEDDDWRSYAPREVANMDAVTAEQGENAPTVVGQSSQPQLPTSNINSSSSDEGDASPARRRRRHDSDASADVSPPRRRRHDSDASADASPPRRRRHDSDASADASPPRRRRHDSDASADASPPRRRRHDSDASADASPPRRRRHDSDASGGDASPPRRRRHGSDASPPRRRQSDSDASPPRRAVSRHSPMDGGGDASAPRRRSGSSDSDASPPRQSGSKREREKMASGASAGLQHAGDFKREQEKLRMKNEKKFSNVTDEMLGRGAKTVYRDKHGRKVDKEAEVARQKAIAAGLESKKAAEEYEWNVGAVQKRKMQAAREHLKKEAAKPLARYKDDKDLDDMLKKRVRADDPMAGMLGSSGSTRLEGGGVGGKRKGSTIRPRHRMCPNRFGIRAGYRWDGEDRGNGFEKRLMLKQSSRKASAEARYKWSVSDM